MSDLGRDAQRDVEAKELVEQTRIQLHKVQLEREVQLLRRWTRTSIASRVLLRSLSPSPRQANVRDLIAAAVHAAAAPCSPPLLVFAGTQEDSGEDFLNKFKEFSD